MRPAPLSILHSLLPSEKILSYQLGFGSTTKRGTTRHSAEHAILSVVIKDGDDLPTIHKTRMAESGRSVSAPLQVVIDDSVRLLKDYIQAECPPTFVASRL